MKAVYLIIYLMLFNFNLWANQLQPLDFDQPLPSNHISILLKICVQLFHHIKSPDLSPEAELVQIDNLLIELIGAAYVLKHQINEHVFIKHEDLAYLLDLIYAINFNFKTKYQNELPAKFDFTSNLFVYVKQILHKIELTTASLHPAYR